MRVRPAAERDPVIAPAEHLAQLPRVLDAARRAHRFVAAEHDQRRKAVLMRALGVRQAVLERMLRRDERHDALARHVVAEIDHEMAEVVFFLGAHRAVREHDERALPRETADRVIRIDPRVHAFARRQLRARRPQLRREHRAA